MLLEISQCHVSVDTALMMPVSMMSCIFELKSPLSFYICDAAKAAHLPRVIGNAASSHGSCGAHVQLVRLSKYCKQICHTDHI